MHHDEREIMAVVRMKGSEHTSFQQSDADALSNIQTYTQIPIITTDVI